MQKSRKGGVATGIRGAYASRVFVAASRSDELFALPENGMVFELREILESSFRRDAETNTRDAYAPRT